MRSDLIERIWYGRGIFARLLAPAAAVFGAVAGVRRWLYRNDWLPRTRLQLPVVVVGNIAVGGTGKTPLTVGLAHGLRTRGLRAGIVCRSYRGSATGPAEVTAASDPAECGDEAVLLARLSGAPVWSGPLRVATARALIAAHPGCDLLLVDDGLQHYALDRDFEIAVVDAHRGLGNARLLPAGPLREPASRLDSVDAVVLNGSGTASPALKPPAFAMSLVGDRFVAVNDAARSETAAYFAGRRVVAVAGIGNPGRFFDHLRALGLQFEAHAFPDHHPFAREELAFPHADAIVMTEKDGIKCRGFDDARMWELPVHAQVPDELIASIAERVRIRRSGPAPG